MIHPVAADEAVSYVRSGDRVFVHTAAAAPALLVEALALLLQKGVDLSASIIGDGDQKALVEQLIAERGIGARVKMLGPRDQAEVRPQTLVPDQADQRPPPVVGPDQVAHAAAVRVRAGERDEVLPARGPLVERLQRLERPQIPRRCLERLEVRADLFVEAGCAQGGVLGEAALRKNADTAGV